MSEQNEKGLQSLAVWHKAIELAVEVCRDAVTLLPIEGKWSLASQLRRAVQSIPANIAEGFGRYYYQESVRYCYIARSSLEETYSHLALARRLDYIPETMLSKLEGEIKELRRMLNGYIGYLKQSKRGITEPGSALHEPSSDYEISIASSPNPSSPDPSSPDPLLPDS